MLSLNTLKKLAATKTSSLLPIKPPLFFSAATPASPIPIRARQISAKIYKTLDNEAFCLSFTNNVKGIDPKTGKPLETKEEYRKHSLASMQATLKPNFFYLMCEKATSSINVETQQRELGARGHVSCFSTDSQGAIISDSELSLRSGTRVPNKFLNFTLTYKDGDTETLETSVWKVNFTSTKEDVIKFIDKANPKDMRQGARKLWLFGISFNSMPKEYLLEAIIEGVKETKTEYQDQDFILANGRIIHPDDITKPIYQASTVNCVKGVYGLIRVTGNVDNPSPQMAVWSILKFLLGKEQVDQLIQSTVFKDPSLERTDDDELIRVDPALRPKNKN